MGFDQGESSNNVETNYSDTTNYIQPGNYVHDNFEGPVDLSGEEQKLIIRDALFPDEENGCGVQEESTKNLQSSDNIFETDASGYNAFPVEGNYFTGEEFLNLNDGLYLETNDLNSTEQDGFNFEDYLTFFDEDDQNLTFDPSQLMGNEDVIPDQEELFQMVYKSFVFDLFSVFL